MDHPKGAGLQQADRVDFDRKRPVEPRCQAFLACQFQGMSSSMRLIL